MKVENQELKIEVYTSLFHNLLTAIKHIHNYLSSCCYSHPVWVNALKYPDASFSQSKPLSVHFNNVTVLSSGSGPASSVSSRALSS